MTTFESFVKTEWQNDTQLNKEQRQGYANLHPGSWQDLPHKIFLFCCQKSLARESRQFCGLEILLFIMHLNLSYQTQDAAYLQVPPIQWCLG